MLEEDIQGPWKPSSFNPWAYFIDKLRLLAVLGIHFIELKMINQELQSQIAQAQLELDTFSDYHALGSIEKRWINNEQINFSLYSANKAKETNTDGLQVYSVPNTIKITEILTLEA